MPIPSRIGVAVVVPLRVARHSRLLLGLEKSTVCPALTLRHVVPPSFDRSTLMLVPVGMCPMMPVTWNSEIGFEIEMAVPRMRFEVDVGVRASNNAPSPWLYTLCLEDEGQ